MKKLCIILSVIIIIGCVLYIAYDKGTDFMVKKTLNILLEDESLKSQIEEAMQNVASFVAPEKSGEGEEPTAEGVAGETEGSVAEGEPAAEEGKRETEKPAGEKNNHEGQGEATGQPKATPKTETPKKNGGSLTMDDLQGADKAYVMSIYNRFTASEVSTVSGMLSGGLTAEEKRKIKSIVYAKVSSAEINKLYAIAKKYQ